MDNIREYINEQKVMKDEIYNAFEASVTCQICSDILIEPMMCMNCQNVICKKCKEDWLSKSHNCPNRCQNPNYQKCLDISELLSKLKFICPKCDNIINYDDVKKHCLTDCKNKKSLERMDSIIDTTGNSINSKKKIFIYIFIIKYSYYNRKCKCW